MFTRFSCACTSSGHVWNSIVHVRNLVNLQCGAKIEYMQIQILWGSRSSQFYIIHNNKTVSNSQELWSKPLLTTYSIITANFKIVEYKPFNDKIRDANYFLLKQSQVYNIPVIIWHTFHRWDTCKWVSWRILCTVPHTAIIVSYMWWWFIIPQFCFQACLYHLQQYNFIVSTYMYT